VKALISCCFHNKYCLWPRGGSCLSGVYQSTSEISNGIHRLSLSSARRAFQEARYSRTHWELIVLPVAAEKLFQLRGDFSRWKLIFYRCCDSESRHVTTRWSRVVSHSPNVFVIVSATASKLRYTDLVFVEPDICTGWPQKMAQSVLNALTLSNINRFLADRTNGRAIATLLRPSSSSVCRRLWRYVLWLNGAS